MRNRSRFACSDLLPLLLLLKALLGGQPLPGKTPKMSTAALTNLSLILLAVLLLTSRRECE
jgi:hypothetical protein